MFIIDKEKNRVSKIEAKSFIDLGFKERENVQEWIANDPTFFNEELLIIQKEFDGFDDTRERLDLLALDKSGNIVVIENKLDDSGRDVVWQVLKYASYCAGLTKNNIKNIFQLYQLKTGQDEDAETKMIDFFEANDFDEIEVNKSQRIIMASGNFRKEVTSTVLWLLNNYKLKIQCFKITPHSLDEQLFLNVEQILPVKEIEEYVIKIAEKNQEESDTSEEIKARHKFRLEFWTTFLDKVNNSETKLFQNISPTKDNWIQAGVGMSGCGLTFAVSKNFARTELSLGRTNAAENKFIFDELLKQKEQIESVFGGPLKWERLDQIKGSRIRNDLENVNIYNKEDWDEMMEFMVDSMVRLDKAFIKLLRVINQKIKKGI
jgi:hypothetical protein